LQILENLNNIFKQILPISTAINNSDTAPDEYLIITPLDEHAEQYIDGSYGEDIQSARLVLFSKINYLPRKNQIYNILCSELYTVTNRQYIGYDNETGYYQYIFDVEK